MAYPFAGTDKCYYCKSLIKWHRVIGQVGDMICTSYGRNDIEAEVTLIGNEDNELEYEVVVTCPCCNMKNKFKKNKRL